MAFNRDRMTYRVLIPTTGDNAEHDTVQGILLAARTLVDDVEQWVGRSRLLRRQIIVTRDGQYDGLVTAKARRGER
jgi:hypothetical protein